MNIEKIKIIPAHNNPDGSWTVRVHTDKEMDVHVGEVVYPNSERCFIDFNRGLSPDNAIQIAKEINKQRLIKYGI